MIAADTSIVVAGFASWHEAHDAARKALAEGARLPAHVAVETLSVLTRLPPPHRASAGVVSEFLGSRFPEPLLTLSEEGFRALLREAPAAEITGGSIYDALIAVTVRQAGATLLTRDLRAVGVYERMGADYRLVH